MASYIFKFVAVHAQLYRLLIVLVTPVAGTKYIKPGMSNVPASTSGEIC